MILSISWIFAGAVNFLYKKTEMKDVKNATLIAYHSIIIVLSF